MANMMVLKPKSEETSDVFRASRLPHSFAACESGGG